MLNTSTTHARANPTQALATHDIGYLFLATVGDFTLHHREREIGRLDTGAGLALPDRALSRIPRRGHPPHGETSAAAARGGQQRLTFVLERLKRVGAARGSEVQ